MSSSKVEESYRSDWTKPAFIIKLVRQKWQSKKKAAIHAQMLDQTPASLGYLPK